MLSVGLLIRTESLKVPTDGVRIAEGIEGVSLELALDLRRLRPRNARLIRFAVVCESEESSESLAWDESVVSDELDEPSISANKPGWDSSSITC